MEKSDIKEIRKAVKSKDTVIDWVYGLYVDSENNAVWEDVGRLSDMEEADRFRHISLFTHILSLKLGCDAYAVDLDAHAEDLLSLRHAPGKDPAEFAPLRDLLLEKYVHTDPYYAAAARVVYDVPAKASDRHVLEDGDTVYEAVLFAICPSSLSKAVLGFDRDHVGELDRRWQIGNPVSGFLYPAFDDRAENRSMALIHSKAPEEEDFISGLFRIRTGFAPVGVKAQRGLFESLIGQMDVTLENAAAISENILEKSAEEDAMLVEKEDLRKIAGAAGVDTEKFDEIYDETVGQVPIALTAVADPYVTVRTDAACLKVPADKAQLIETRTIDGRDYILIPADGTVTVNGVSVTAGAADIPPKDV